MPTDPLQEPRPRWDERLTRPKIIQAVLVLPDMRARTVDLQVVPEYGRTEAWWTLKFPVHGWNIPMPPSEQRRYAEAYEKQYGKKWAGAPNAW